MKRTISTSVLLYLTLVSFAAQCMQVGQAMERHDNAALWWHGASALVFAALIAYLDDLDERRARRRSLGK